MKLIKIEKIKRIPYKGKVYDLEVEDNHSYNVNGIIVHNSICSTFNKTGFTVPMFSCCLQCAPVCEKYDVPFIADGGIKEFGDIAKALCAGANLCMAGGIFAECIDSPAEIINGHKQYRGSTSFEMKGVHNHIEGKKIEIVHSVKYSERLEELKQALQSSVSYAGGADLSVFNLVNYIII